MAEYTLVQSGDGNAAESIGSLVGTIPVGRIIDGFALSGYDPGAPSIDVEAGKAAHILETALAEWTLNDGTQQSGERDLVQLTTHLDARTVQLESGAVNHLYVDPNVGTSNSPQLVVTTGTVSAAGALKIGEVDTAADAVSGQWRLVAADGTLTFPDEAAASAAAGELPNGTVVYTRSEAIHWSTIADSLKRLATWSDPDGDGVYQLPNDSDGIDVATVSAETLLGADVVNSAENQILVAQGDGTLAVETQAQGPNPYDQASSFEESGVTTSLTNTAVENGSILLRDFIIIDDFEDGDITTKSSSWDGWTGSIGDLTAQSDVVIDGQFSGEFTINNGSKSIKTTRSSDVTTSTLATLRVDNETSSSGDSWALTTLSNSGDTVFTVEFIDGGDIRLNNGEFTLGFSWSPNTNYSIEVDYDFANEDYSLIINGSEIGTYPFNSSASGWGVIEIGNGTSFSGQTRSVYFDNIYARDAKPTSGSATIEWDRGIPTDIFEWDVATYTRTLDGETVDVFVAYSSDGGATWTRTNGGNPISRNYTLSDDPNITASDDVRIEAELSRTDTSNNPTLDSAYRSWLV